MNPRISSLVPLVSAFTGEEWRDWLIELLTTRRSTPPLSINHDRASQELMEVADALAAARRVGPFAEGVVLACQVLPPRTPNAFALLTLIELIAGLTPQSGKAVLWNLLRGRELTHLRAANAKLEVIAVSALVCYGVDSALLEYVAATAHNSMDLNVLANCFYAARQSENRVQTCRSFMPLLLRACKTRRDFRRVADEVRALSISYEFRDFRHWLLVDASEVPGIPGAFTDALRSDVLPFLHAKMPFHARALELAILAQEGSCTPEVAVQHLGSLLRVEPVDLADIIDFASDLWTCLRRVAPRQRWSLHQTSKMHSLADTIIFYRADDLEDQHAILNCELDGVLLNILNIALIDDPALRAQLRTQLLEMKDPKQLGVSEIT